MSGDESLSALLEPSLRGEAPARPLYSIRAGFLVAFFGGPYAALIFASLNSRRAGRLTADLKWWLALGALWTGALWWMMPATLTSGPPALRFFVPSELRVLVRICGLLTFGVVCLVHRALQRASTLREDAPPSPWLPGVGALLAALALTAAVAVTRLSVG